MANQRWLGRALPTAQVDTITVALTWATADTVALTINGRTLTLTVGTDTTTAQVATAIKEMWNGDTQTGTGDHTFSETGNNVAEFDEITATVASSVVTLTADTKGVPFTLSVVETTAGDGTATEATATAATGPNHWDDANNWSGAAVPGNSDDVYIDNSDVSIKYGLGQSAVTLTSLNIAASFTGDIGLPKTNADGGYPEYRADYLAISATNCTIGRGEGIGSGRIKIDFGSNQTAVEVVSTGSGSETDLEAVLLQGTHASNTLEVHTGSAGVAPHGADASTFTTVDNAEGTVQCYGNTTIGTAALAGGELILQVAPTTLTQRGGLSTILGSGAVTTLTVEGGTCQYQSSGTITTATIGGRDGATLDLSGDISGRTITTLTLDRGGLVVDPHATLTLTNNVVRGTDVSQIQVS